MRQNALVMDYTEPRIVLTDSMEKRSYITFQINGRRVREYTGFTIGVQISPNKASSIAERNYLMELLCNHIKNSLENGTYTPPVESGKRQKKEEPMLGQLKYTLEQSLDRKRKQKLAPKYIRNLEKLLDDFLLFLNEKEKSSAIDKLSSQRVQEFLNRYNKSATYYMTIRRHFKVLMAEAEKVTMLVIPAAKALPRQKVKPKAHIPYTPQQLKDVFHYLKVWDKHLYLCTMLCYGCWLRPHNEVGKLTAGNFKEGCRKIILDAEKNKSGRIRSVLVPDEVRRLLIPIVADLAPSDNIFTRVEETFNDDYFSKRWQRARKKMLQRGIIEPGHTIYSFRHTAAIDLYRRTRDVSLLQRIMGHVEITTTMTYLRGLGELNEQDWEIGMPTFYGI